jgi:molecular chaperone GrpE
MTKKEAESKKQESERDEYLNGWKRAKADLINYKKEEENRIRQAIQFGNELLISDLLAVFQSFELGLQATKEGSAEEKGMKLIKTQLEDTLKRYGLEMIHAKPGSEPDPQTTEAIEEVESESAAGTVVEEVERGYKLHGKVIKPIKVKVSA